MEAKDVRNLPWETVTDWSKLSATDQDIFGNFYITKKDLDSFVTNVFRNISHKLHCPHEELLPILEEENEAFYTIYKEYFHDHCSFSLCRQEHLLKAFKNALRVPDTSGIEKPITKSNVDSCLQLFENLSDMEKIIFLQKIGKINVKVEYATVPTGKEAN